MQSLRSQRDEPNTSREYETIYILRPDATSEQIHEVNTRVRKVIDDVGGKVLRLDNWGKRKLAYEIRKELKGIYLYWLYLGSSGLVTEIERNLRMLDLVIRYFTVAVDENVHPEVRPSHVDDDSFAAAATVVPDEEDTYMGRTFEEELADESEEGTHGDKGLDKEETTLLKDHEPPQTKPEASATEAPEPEPDESDTHEEED